MAFLVQHHKKICIINTLFLMIYILLCKNIDFSGKFSVLTDHIQIQNELPVHEKKNMLKNLTNIENSPPSFVLHFSYNNVHLNILLIFIGCCTAVYSVTSFFLCEHYENEIMDYNVMSLVTEKVKCNLFFVFFTVNLTACFLQGLFFLDCLFWLFFCSIIGTFYVVQMGLCTYNSLTEYITVLFMLEWILCSRLFPVNSTFFMIAILLFINIHASVLSKVMERKFDAWFYYFFLFVFSIILIGVSTIDENLHVNVVLNSRICFLGAFNVLLVVLLVSN